MSYHFCIVKLMNRISVTINATQEVHRHIIILQRLVIYISFYRIHKNLLTDSHLLSHATLMMLIKIRQQRQE